MTASGTEKKVYEKVRWEGPQLLGQWRSKLWGEAPGALVSYMSANTLLPATTHKRPALPRAHRASDINMACVLRRRHELLPGHRSGLTVPRHVPVLPKVTGSADREAHTGNMGSRPRI